MDLRPLEHLVSSPGAYAFVFLLGTLWGSFANVCIYRWPPTDDHPKGRSVVKPGSHCSACKTPIRWYDNVPLLSYLWLRGKCRDCHAKFSPRYLLVEALTGALFAVAWWAAVDVRAPLEAIEPRLVRFAIYALFCFVMVVVTFIDLDTMLILDRVVLPMIPVFYAASLVLPGRPWWDGLVGAAIGFGGPWLIGEAFYRIRGREGLGMGDAKFLGLVGALLGWRGVAVSLFGGAVLGLAVTLTILLLRGAPKAGADGEQTSLRTVEMPFGPYLAAAATFYLFAEPWVIIRFPLLGI